MKIRSFFVLSLSLLNVGGLTPTKLPNDFTYIEVPPLNFDSSISVKIKIEAMFMGVKMRHFVAKVFNDIYTEGRVFYELRLNTRDFNFEIEYPNRFTDYNTYFVFSEETDNKNVTIHPRFAEGPIINPSTYEETGEFNNVTVYTKENGINYVNENYYFKGFDSIYIPDYYHKINISSFQLKTGFDDVDLTRYKSAVFFIYDPDELFENLGPSKVNGYISIPLILEKNRTGFYSLKFQNSIYVNPITLKMSLSYKDKYVKTRHLYFPINEQRNEDTYRFGINILDFGYNLAYVSHTFTVKTYKNLVGDCTNSEYCIGIASSKGDSNG